MSSLPIPDLAARVELSNGAQPATYDPGLLESILNRQTVRKACKPDPIPPDVQDALKACSDAPGLPLYLNEAFEVRQLISSLAVRADAKQFHNPTFREELVNAAEQGATMNAPWSASSVACHRCF